MADAVNEIMEAMVPALEDMEKRGLLRHGEVKITIRKRQDFEYSLHRRDVTPAFYREAINYELMLRELIVERKRKLKVKEVGLGDYEPIKRAQFLYQRCVRKFPSDMQSWLDFFEFGRKNKATRTLAITFSKAIQLHPRKIEMWSAAASFERSSGNWGRARSLFMRAIRINSEDVAFYAAYMRFEIDFAKMLIARRTALGLTSYDKNEDVSIDRALEEDGDLGGGDAAASESEGVDARVRDGGALAIMAYDQCVRACGARDMRVHVEMLKAATGALRDIWAAKSSDGVRPARAVVDHISGQMRAAVGETLECGMMLVSFYAANPDAWTASVLGEDADDAHDPTSEAWCAFPEHASVTPQILAMRKGLRALPPAQSEELLTAYATFLWCLSKDERASSSSCCCCCR